VADRPLRLGPDPNRTYLERWNELHPDRYGRPDSPAETKSERHRSADDVDEASAPPSPSGFLESLLGLAIFILSPIIGLFVTLPLYQWTRPDSLTPGWIIGYAAAFVVTTFAGAMLVYALRRVLLIFALATLTFGIGYATWHLWIA
jgi:hypothetical protein